MRYFLKFQEKSRFFSCVNAAPLIKICRPHFAAPHEEVTATPKKIAAPGRQKPEMVLPGHNLQKRP